MTRALALLLVSVAACGPAREPIEITVVPLESSGGESLAATLVAPIDPSVELRVAAVPDATAAPSVDADLATRLAQAREAYATNADFEACTRALEAPELLPRALGRRDRESAARLLTYRCACALAAGDEGAARDAAAALGALDLPLPAETASVSPRAERMLADASVAAHAAPRGVLAITSVPVGASVRIDGGGERCRTPCELDLTPGEHVVTLELDGRDDAIATARVESNESTDLALETTPATPGTAARQWRERHAGAPDAWVSLRLLQSAVRDPRVVLVERSVDAADSRIRIRAALAIEAERPMHVERLAAEADAERETRAALRELLTEAGVIPPRPLTEEPLFWIAVIGAAGIAAGVTAAALYEPDVRVPVYVGGRGP